MHSRVQPLRADPRPADRRSVAQVLADVVGNLQDMLGAQIRLAQAEARGEMRTFRAAGTLILIGVLVGVLSAFFLLLAIVAALSLVISVWAAALIVAFGTAGLCAILLRVGVNHVRSQAARISASEEEKAPWTMRPTR